MSHAQVVEATSQENMEFDNEVEQRESQFAGICASMILAHDLPFNFLELEVMRKYTEFLNPNAVIPPTNVIEAYVSHLYTKEKLKLKQELASIPNRISLTFDLWESNTTETYICLTAHFVDANWKLNSKVLNFRLVYPPIAAEISERMIELLNDWGIEKKIFSLTLDDSFENNVMLEQLKNQLCLRNGLLCDGEFFHAHCFACVLKLIAEEGLKLVSGAVYGIRDSIMFVRNSKNRRTKFKECIEKVGGVDSSVRLHLDMSMSLNSTYVMLESALKYRHVFESFHLYDDNYLLCPLAHEWKRVEKICAFLLPFYETANMINDTTHPTSNLCFLQVWKVQCVLVDSLGDEDKVIKRMAERMMSEFDKYWDEYSVVLALGAVLDPRMKFSTLAYCYSKLDPSTCEQKLQLVKRKLYMLFDKYSSKSTSSGLKRTTQDQSSTMPLQKKLKSLSHGLFNELKVHQRQLVTETRKSQLDVYLDESNLDFHCYEDMDVLQWWKRNNNRFPDLSILACDLLSVPIATVASDSEFCMGSRVFNKYEDRMLPTNVETRICTRSWLYNFVSDDREGDRDDLDGIMNEIDNGEKMVQDIEEISQENVESIGEIDQLWLVKRCASMILSNDFPFDFFEREGMSNFMKVLNPNAVMPPINVIKAYVSDLYTKAKLKLKQELATIPNRISLTVDLWESCTTETYICLTAHFADANWKLKSKVLTFCTVDPTGAEMCERMVEFLSDWGIEKKIFSLTLDDSSDNDILQELLKTQLGLQNGLLCDGEFFHGHCYARLLKLIVEEGLKLVSDAVSKIRQSILFFRDSKSRSQKFKECVEKVGGVDSSVRLHLDMSMTVNSTYLMLESALKYRCVFESLHLYDDNYELCPSVEEWKRVEKICAFLLPLRETANMINGTAHPTSNMYFLLVWKVQCVLADSLRDEDEAIKRMAERMMSKFEKYWDEYSVVLALGAVLDPRMKFSTLAHCYSKLDVSACERKLQEVKSKLYMLFDKYSSKSISSGVQRTIQDESSSMPLQKKLKSSSHGLFDELKTHHEQLVTGKSQLDIYLAESHLDFRCYEDMDVLQWWKSNNNRFPDLSILARDLLSVPVNTIASDLDFCMGLHVFNKYKDRMLPMNLDARFCTRNWLYNFVHDVGEDDDDFEEIMNETDSDD